MDTVMECGRNWDRVMFSDNVRDKVEVRNLVKVRDREKARVGDRVKVRLSIRVSDRVRIKV